MRVKNDHEASPYAHWWFYFEVEDGEESENTIVVAFPLFLFEFIKNNALVFPKRAYKKEILNEEFENHEDLVAYYGDAQWWVIN